MTLLEPTWLTFPGYAIMFPSVYQSSPDFSNVPRFTISADSARAVRRSREDTAFVERFASDKGRINAKSPYSPEIECDDVPGLVKALQYLDARNINRDRIFPLCPLVSFSVVPFHYTLPRDPQDCVSGYALRLQRVRIITLPTEDVLCSPSTLK